MFMIFIDIVYQGKVLDLRLVVRKSDIFSLSNLIYNDISFATKRKPIAKKVIFECYSSEVLKMKLLYYLNYSRKLIKL